MAFSYLNRDSDKRSDDTGSILGILQTLHRKIAINYCRIGLYDKAKRYVMYRLTYEYNPQSEGDYERQLKTILEEKERQKADRKSHAKGVIAQDNPVCFLSLCLIAVHINRLDEAIKFSELLFKTNELDKELSLPILTAQKIISLTIERFHRYDLAQIMVSKFMISNPLYSIGYYLLFLLAIKNRDPNAIIGSWKKFNEVYLKTTGSRFEPMEVYWPLILSKILKLPISKL